jgi:hypothetical protein
MKDLVHLGEGEAMRQLGAGPPGREFGGAARAGGAGRHRYHFLSGHTDKHEISEIWTKFC